MIPGAYSFECYIGGTFNELMTFRDSALNLVDLTGCSGSMDVRDDQGNLQTTLSTSGGGMTLGGSAGTIQLTIPAVATASFTPGLYRYDLYVVYGNGEKDYWLVGDFSIVQRVTTT